MAPISVLGQVIREEVSRRGAGIAELKRKEDMFSPRTLRLCVKCLHFNKLGGEPLLGGRFVGGAAAFPLAVFRGLPASTPGHWRPGTIRTDRRTRAASIAERNRVAGSIQGIEVMSTNAASHLPAARVR